MQSMLASTPFSRDICWIIIDYIDESREKRSAVHIQLLSKTVNVRHYYLTVPDNPSWTALKCATCKQTSWRIYSGYVRRYVDGFYCDYCERLVNRAVAVSKKQS